MAETDPLFDVPEPALSARIQRFAKRIAQLTAAPVYMVECPMERAMMNLTLAVEELDGALLLARSADEHSAIRSTAEDAINRLLTMQTVSWTLERFDRQRS